MSHNQSTKRFLYFLLCLLLLFFIDDLLIRNRMKEIQFTLDLVAQNTAERLESAKSLVELAAASADVAQSEPPVTEAFLKNMVQASPAMWSHFLVADPTGTEFVHTEGSIHYGKSIADREYFKTPNVERRTVIAQPIHSVSTGRKIIAIGTPLFDERGSYQSVLVGFIHLRYVSDVVNLNSFSANSYQLMANQDGTISAHPNESYILSAKTADLFSEETAARISALERGVRLGLVEGSPSIVAYTPLKGSKLSIITVLPLTEAFFHVLFIDGILLAMFVAVSLILRADRKLKQSHTYAKKMEHAASTDKLTGLRNRRWLEGMEVAHFCDESFTVIFFDVDDFKNFNDRNNHVYGDEVLRFIGRCMMTCTRPETDIAVRYAGDEFILLLKDLNAQKANLIAQRLMFVLMEYVNAKGESDIITISCGIASGNKHRHNLFDVIAKADNATYAAKRSGKNRIVMAETDP